MEGLCLDSEDVKRFFVYKVTNNLATQKATKNMPADPKMRCIHCGRALQSILGKKERKFLANSIFKRGIGGNFLDNF